MSIGFTDRMNVQQDFEMQKDISMGLDNIAQSNHTEDTKRILTFSLINRHYSQELPSIVGMWLFIAILGLFSLLAIILSTLFITQGLVNMKEQVPQ